MSGHTDGQSGSGDAIATWTPPTYDTERHPTLLKSRELLEDGDLRGNFPRSAKWSVETRGKNHAGQSKLWSDFPGLQMAPSRYYIAKTGLSRSYTRTFNPYQVESTSTKAFIQGERYRASVFLPARPYR